MRMFARALAGLFLPALLLAAAPRAPAASLELLPVQAPVGAGLSARGDRYLPDQLVTLRLVALETRRADQRGFDSANKVDATPTRRSGWA